MANSLFLQKWLLYTPAGNNVLWNEKSFYYNAIKNIFGYYALQLGFNQINFLDGNKITRKYTIPQHIQCNFTHLPLANNSVDLIICPHLIESHTDYLIILEECYRVLMPQGKLIITSFNSYGLFSYWFRKQLQLKATQLVSAKVIQQQLCSIGFNITGGEFFAYRPALNNPTYLDKLQLLDKIINRWLPTHANCYAVIANKTIITSNIIGAKLSRQYVLQPALQ